MWNGLVIVLPQKKFLEVIKSKIQDMKLVDSLILKGLRTLAPLGMLGIFDYVYIQYQCPLQI